MEGEYAEAHFPTAAPVRGKRQKARRGWQTFKTKLGLNVKKEPWVAEAVAK